MGQRGLFDIPTYLDDLEIKSEKNLMRLIDYLEQLKYQKEYDIKEITKKINHLYRPDRKIWRFLNYIEDRFRFDTFQKGALP